MPNLAPAPIAPVPAQTFVDRERELDLIFGHLTARQRGNVAVWGSLGMGKTSLLRHIADPEVAAAYGATAAGLILVHLDIQAVAPFGADRFWHRVAHLVARSAGPELAAAAREIQARATIDIIDIEIFLDHVAEAHSALVLLLDEFEWALQADSAAEEADSRNFLAQLASLARRSPRTLALVVATERPLTEVVDLVSAWRGSPFPTLFTTVQLKPLSREASDRLIDAWLDLQGTSWTLSEVDRHMLHAAAAGRPSALEAAVRSLAQSSLQGLDRQAARGRAESAAAGRLEELRPLTAKPSTPTVSLLPSVGEWPRGGECPSIGEWPSRADFAADGLWLDQASSEVYLDGMPLEGITALEFNLLALFYRRPGQICSKDDILRQLWGEETAGTIDVARVEKLISRLRNKIEATPGRPNYIRTVRGRGYRYVPGAVDAAPMAASA
jgi:DNA-binding winged helix-turn-helix (wHTH) protein